MDAREQQALLTICLMAAFADGGNDDREREQIRRIAESLSPTASGELSGLYQDVLLQRCSLEDTAPALSSPGIRQLAYEMAVCVCDADGSHSDAEMAFLERLRLALSLDAQASQAFVRTAAAVAASPLGEGASGEAAGSPGEKAQVDTEALDKLVLNASIVNGALELLPQSLASMAILPLQMKMVYRIGQAYGYELDRGHIKDFVATLGVGLTGQYVEQMGRKLLGGLFKAVGGDFLGGLGSAATGSAFSFATTYALGQVARQYYAGGRDIDMNQLKQVFASLLEQGKDLQQRYAETIQQKAKTVDVKHLAEFVRQQ